MDKSLYDWVKLILENMSLWPLVAVTVLVWLSRQKELLTRLTKVSFGGFEFQLQELKDALAVSKLEIKALENDLEQERNRFEELLTNFDPHAETGELRTTREMLVANARSLENLAILHEFLSVKASPEQLFAAATTLRERRPTQFFGDLVSCLERLASDPELHGIRLNTVWALTSALHRILIAAIRDRIQPAIHTDDLKRAAKMLAKLENNPRVQSDRPDNPAKGIRGPIELARKWIDRGLSM